MSTAVFGLLRLKLEQIYNTLCFNLLLKSHPVLIVLLKEVQDLIELA